MSVVLSDLCSMHCSYQQISMSAERTVTTVGRPASTNLVATSACVLKGTCYTEMDGDVNVSSRFMHHQHSDSQVHIRLPYVWKFWL